MMTSWQVGTINHENKVVCKVMLKVSVIIATYNRCKDLQECLDSLFNMADKPYEIIVVDSCSTDGTEKVKDCYPIKFISIQEKNRQKARNVGISVTRGNVVVFLDDDVVVDRKWSKYLIKPYEDSRVGGVGGRVITYGKPKDYYIKVKNRVVGKVFDNGLVLGNFDTPLQYPTKVDSLIGCNMSFRRDLLLKAGGFDENFKGNCFRDDTDICLRVRKLGYKLIYQPKALAWHKFKGKTINHEWIYWYVRNHTYFYLKNVFPQSRAKLPIFLYRTFFPPRDYVLKSGVKVKFGLGALAFAFKGLLHGAKAWQGCARLEHTLKDT